MRQNQIENIRIGLGKHKLLIRALENVWIMSIVLMMFCPLKNCTASSVSVCENLDFVGDSQILSLNGALNVISCLLITDECESIDQFWFTSNDIFSNFMTIVHVSSICDTDFCGLRKISEFFFV